MFNFSPRSLFITSRSLLLTSSVLLTVLFAFPLSQKVLAQPKVTNTIIGISGLEDKNSRSPVLTVSTEPSNGSVKILADAYQRHPEYTQYPMRYTFFINGDLFTQQLVSAELPRPIGIDVGSDRASVPFNYSVVVETLTPEGRHFTTILNGAVFTSELGAILDCTLSFVSTSNTSFVDNGVLIEQTSNNGIRFSFSGNAIESSDTAQGTFTGTITNGTLNGTFAFTTNDNGLTQQVETIEGTATTSDSGGITSLNGNSADASLALVCS